MGSRRTLAEALLGYVPLGLLVAGLAGCAALPPNSLLDPTAVGTFPGDAQESGIRRVLSPRDTPPGLLHATEPTAEDLVPWYDEYRFGPGDVLTLTVNDLLVQGFPYQASVEVNALGEIRLPELGTMKVAGLTERELEIELGNRLREAGLLPKPVVLVFPQARRGMQFNIIGAVTRPGAYPILGPDMRLLDAVAMVGDVSATAKWIYIIRRNEMAAPLVPVDALPATPSAPVIDDEKYVIPPPEEEDSGYQGMLITDVAYYTQEPPPEPTRDVTREELEDVMSPDGRRAQPAAPATTRSQLPPLVFFDPETGEMLEPEEAREEEPEGTEEAEDAPSPWQEEEFEQPFDWAEIEEFELEQRVIAVPVRELKSGNPRYNIVVRGRDVINVPIDTGVFYLMGQLNRPGVYAFGGRDITVKQALATAGGFAQLAWPQRCEVIRREPGTDKQLTIPVNLDAIFAGLEDDFYLRDDDILNVGTHIAAPFLFVIRNSFRFTYGFGFVYDRNYGDVDSYNARPNPKAVELSRDLQRGLPF